MLNYLYLVIAVLLEVCGTLLLPLSQGFTRLIPTAVLTLCYIVAFYLLSQVVKFIPVSIVYATWSGLGVFTVAICSYFFFNQTLNWQAIVGLFLIIIGVILVNSFHSAHV